MPQLQCRTPLAPRMIKKSVQLKKPARCRVICTTNISRTRSWTSSTQKKYFCSAKFKLNSLMCVDCVFLESASFQVVRKHRVGHGRQEVCDRLRHELPGYVLSSDYSVWRQLRFEIQCWERQEYSSLWRHHLFSGCQVQALLLKHHQNPFRKPFRRT